jgi:hypothetical protein
MQVIQITSLTGHSPYDITICDITNTYCYSGVTGATSVPLTIDIPTELSGTTELLVVVTDSIGCQEIQYHICDEPIPSQTPTPTPTITPTNLTCNCISIENPSGVTLNFGYTQCDGTLFYGEIYSATTLFVCGSSPYGDTGLIFNVSSDICINNECPQPTPTPTTTPTPTPTLPPIVGYFQDSCNPSYEFTLSDIPVSFSPISGDYYVESSGYVGCAISITGTSSTNIFSFVALGSQPSTYHCQKANFIYPCPTLTPTPSITPTITPTPTVTMTVTPTNTITPTPTTSSIYNIFKVRSCCDGDEIIKFMSLPSYFLPGISVVDNSGNCWRILSTSTITPNEFWNHGTTYLFCDPCIDVQTCSPIPTVTQTTTPTPTVTPCVPQMIYSGENFTSMELSNGASFKSDGTIVYVSAHNGSPLDNISAYSLSTPWDVSTINLPKIGNSIGFPLGNPSSVIGQYFSPDGLNLFFANSARNGVFKYTLSTPWDVSTSIYSPGDFVTGATLTGASFLEFTPDGLFMFVTVTGSLLKKYSLTTPWVISSGVVEIQSISVDTTFDFTFQNNGYYLFSMIDIFGSVNIRKQVLSTPYDLTSIVLTETKDVTSFIPNGNLYTISFRDGFKGFISGYYSSGPARTEVYAFNLTCEYDINGSLILPTPTPTPTNTLTPTPTQP